MTQRVGVYFLPLYRFCCSKLMYSVWTWLNAFCSTCSVLSEFARILLNVFCVKCVSGFCWMYYSVWYRIIPTFSASRPYNEEYRPPTSTAERRQFKVTLVLWITYVDKVMCIEDSSEGLGAIVSGTNDLLLLGQKYVVIETLVAKMNAVKRLDSRHSFTLVVVGNRNVICHCYRSNWSTERCVPKEVHWADLPP